MHELRIGHRLDCLSLSAHKLVDPSNSCNSMPLIRFRLLRNSIVLKSGSLTHCYLVSPSSGSHPSCWIFGSAIRRQILDHWWLRIGTLCEAQEAISWQTFDMVDTGYIPRMVQAGAACDAASGQTQ